jgi:predicted RNA binding protein YcfA (HicA-like mRNA interferase family)
MYLRLPGEAAASLGFVKGQQKKNLAFYKHPDGRVTILPHHKAKVLARLLIREILREIEISINDYNNLLKNL